MNSKIPVVILAAAVTLAAGLPALRVQAAEPAVDRVVVKLGDLDLDRPADAQAAATRIRLAAAQVCRGGRAPSPDLVGRSERFRRCRAAALSRAVAQLDAPLVRQAFEDRRARDLRLAWR